MGRGKNDLQHECNNVRTPRFERAGSLTSAVKQVEEMGKALTNALHDVVTAESKANVAEVLIIFNGNLVLNYFFS